MNPAATRAVRLVVVGLAVIGTATSASADYNELLTDSKPLLVAFDINSGKQQWRLPEKDPGALFVAAADRKRVYVTVTKCLSADRQYRSGDSTFIVLDAKTGSERWRIKNFGILGDRKGGETLADSSQATLEVIVPLYSPSEDTVRGLDPKNGRELWRVSAEGLAPAAGTRDLLFLTPATNYRRSEPPAASRIVAIDTRSGEERWSVRLDHVAAFVAAGPNAVAVLSGFHGGPPRMTVLALTDGSIVADVVVQRTGVNLHHFAVTSTTATISASSAADPPHTLAYELATGRVAWSVYGIYFASVGSVQGAEVLFGTHRFPPRDPSAPFPGLGPHVAFDAKTGTEIWSVPNHGGITGSSGENAIAVDGQEYEGSYSVVESITALATDTGELRWSLTPGKQDAEPYDRRYPETFTVRTFVGKRAVYISGGCAVSALN